MLHHYLQVRLLQFNKHAQLLNQCYFYFLSIMFSSQAKNGEALPQMSRPQQALQPVTKEQPSVGERDEMESKALQAVQCSLLKILSKTLATLQHFTPDCCQILLDQVHAVINGNKLSFLSGLGCVNTIGNTYTPTFTQSSNRMAATQCIPSEQRKNFTPVALTNAWWLMPDRVVLSFLVTVDLLVFSHTTV